MSSPIRTWLVGSSLLLAAGVAANACSANGDPAATSGSGASGATATGAGGMSSSSGDGGDLDLDGGTTGTGGSGQGGSCASISAEAELGLSPADIIIAVDTSGSMSEESSEVQANLNNFATIITQSGVDVHVVLIADEGVCIPSPLGTGQCGSGCADENLPSYQHVCQGVSSTDALQKILDTYPLWKSSLRPDATKTFLVVSDDESDLSASDFTNALLALDPPTFQGFKFDAIVSDEGPGVCTACFFACATCQSACCDKSALCIPLSAAEGKIYKELVNQTGGVFGDLCAQDFGPTFQDMATGVVQSTTLACSFDIPMNGGTIDPTKVNVNYTASGSNMPQAIGYVAGGLAACGPSGGFYYDDPNNPTKILLCPATCTAVQSDTGGKIDVLFGCDTILQPPE